MKTLVSPSPLSHEPTSEQLLTLNQTALSGVSGGETAPPTEYRQHYTTVRRSFQSSVIALL